MAVYSGEFAGKLTPEDADARFDPDIVAVMLELIAEGKVPVDIC